MANLTAILARRSASAGILISDDVAAARLAWHELRSADGDAMRVEWRLRIACVDTPADRQLLVEHFADRADVTVAAVTQHLEHALAPRVRRLVEAETTDRLLDGGREDAICQAIEAEARREAFAIGLSLMPPFALRIESPSRDRDRRAAELQARREAMGATDVRADPLALLRAAAEADPAWSAASPMLWVVAGHRLMPIDPTRPTPDLGRAIALPTTLGPLRSVRGATIDGAPVLLVGARDGVFVVDRDSSATPRALANPTGSDFGYNAACFVERDRMVVATHSAAGVVAWRWDEPAAPPLVSATSHARSIVALEHAAAMLIADGRLVTFVGDDALSPTGRDTTSVVRIDAEHLAAIGDDGAVALLTAADLAPGAEVVATHAGGPIAAVTGVDLAGVPRVVVAMTNGGLRLLDFGGAPAVPIGPANLAVRSLASRPGFLVAVGVDRSRVFVIDLATPEAIAAELHVAATLGSRVADVWFA